MEGTNTLPYMIPKCFSVLKHTHHKLFLCFYNTFIGNVYGSVLVPPYIFFSQVKFM